MNFQYDGCFIYFSQRFETHVHVEIITQILTFKVVDLLSSDQGVHYWHLKKVLLMLQPKKWTRLTAQMWHFTVGHLNLGMTVLIEFILQLLIVQNENVL